jgi:hypothetical protein
VKKCGFMRKFCINNGLSGEGEERRFVKGALLQNTEKRESVRERGRASFIKGVPIVLVCGHDLLLGGVLVDVIEEESAPIA